MAFENSLVNVDKLCLNINNVKEIFFNKPVLLNNQYEVKLNIINYPIYNNINYYGIHNFALAILEDLGNSGSVSKEILLSREQFYLEILFYK